MQAALPFPITSRHPTRVASVTRDAGAASPRAVQDQLSKILRSDGFVHARRMRRFLAFIVEESLAGRADQLCEYSIGVTVFERGESFEPGLDPIVRNDARRLRQKLLEYYQCCRAGDQVVIEVPKGGYAPVFTLCRKAQPCSLGEPYRLTVRLTRVSDGVEVWVGEQEIEGIEKLGLQFEFDTGMLQTG